MHRVVTIAGAGRLLRLGCGLRHQGGNQRGDTGQCQQGILCVASASVDEEQRGESEQRGDENAVRRGVEVLAERALHALEQRLAHLRENLRTPGLREEFERANHFRATMSP